MPANKKKYKASVANQRKIQAYPPPKYHVLFERYVASQEMTDSEAATLMIKSFFDRMPPTELVRYK